MKIQGVFGPWYDTVLLDGTPLDPRPSQAVFNHSPDGFAWGYGGSGPSQLALAILLEAGVEPDEAVRLHHDFKFAFVAEWPVESSFEADVDVLGWVESRRVPA